VAQGLCGRAKPFLSSSIFTALSIHRLKMISLPFEEAATRGSEALP
jgi:hypothetical protein